MDPEIPNLKLITKTIKSMARRLQNVCFKIPRSRETKNKILSRIVHLLRAVCKQDINKRRAEKSCLSVCQ